MLTFAKCGAWPSLHCFRFSPYFFALFLLSLSKEVGPTRCPCWLCLGFQGLVNKYSEEEVAWLI